MDESLRAATSGLRFGRNSDRRSRARLAVLLLAVAATLATGCTSSDSAGRPDETDIVYVAASWLPETWVVGHATERVGPPVDYTLVWRPASNAGASRSDSTDTDDGPKVWANVGAAAYIGTPSYEELSEFDLDNVEVVEEAGYLTLDFHLGCCMIALGGEGVDADLLTRVASGLSAIPQKEWRAALGERLLIDGD